MTDYFAMSVPALYREAASSWGMFTAGSGIAATRDMRFSFGDYAVKTRGHNVEGSTGFLRSQILQESVIQRSVERAAGRPVRVLVAPGALGSEALSLSMIAEHFFPDVDVKIDTFDISSLFTAIATKTSYPAKMIVKLDPHYKAMFHEAHFDDAGREKYVSASPSVVSRINILPPENIFNFQPHEPYDVVFCMNLLRHIDDSGVVKVLKSLVPLSQGVLCVNGFEKFSEEHNPEHFTEYEALESRLREEEGFSLIADDFSLSSDGRSLPRLKGASLRDQCFNVEREIDGCNFVLAKV